MIRWPPKNIRSNKPSKNIPFVSNPIFVNLAQISFVPLCQLDWTPRDRWRKRDAIGRECVWERASERGRERERKKLQLWLWRSRGLISKRGKMSLLRWFPFISSRPEWTMVSYVPVTFRHRQTHALHTHTRTHFISLSLSLSLTHTHTHTNKHTLSVLTHRKEKWGHIDLTAG